MEPCPSNEGWSEGPVASLRVQAEVVNPASVSDARTSHLVVRRDMGEPFLLTLRCGG